MNKKRIIIGLLLIAIAILFIFIARSTRKQAATSVETAKQLQNVSVQSVADSASYVQTIQYPATVVGDQEIRVSAKSSGTATAVNYNLGDRVSVGALLVKVDDVGNSLKTGDEGFKSSEVQQSQLSVEQAKEQLDSAEKTYKNLKNQYDYEKKNPTAPQTVTKTQKDSAKEAVDLAEIQLESAKVGYKGTLDSHLITSPISGYVTQKLIAVGDSISVGQQLFSISKTMNMKIQFYVDESQLGSISKNQEITMTDNSGKNSLLLVRNISPQADSATKRFLIEAYPKQIGATNLFSGTIASVSFETMKTPKEEGDLILPLSAINIGQNENYIFLSENNRAKKTDVEVTGVEGETANIKVILPTDAKIIINGSKLVQDGQEITITQ